MCFFRRFKDSGLNEKSKKSSRKKLEKKKSKENIHKVLQFQYLAFKLQSLGTRIQHQNQHLNARIRA